MSNVNLKKPVAWVEDAVKHLGMREIRGVNHNKNILRWLKELGAWWSDDETPWCGTFVAHCLSTTNRAIPKHWYRAKAYGEYGTVLAEPAYGSIGVMDRKGGGHVCFIIGETTDKKSLVVIGGNQGDTVCYAEYPKTRFTAYVWPPRVNGLNGFPYDYRYELPKYEKGDYLMPVSEA